MAPDTSFAAASEAAAAHAVSVSGHRRCARYSGWRRSTPVTCASPDDLSSRSFSSPLPVCPCACRATRYRVLRTKPRKPQHVSTAACCLSARAHAPESAVPAAGWVCGAEHMCRVLMPSAVDRRLARYPITPLCGCAEPFLGAMAQQRNASIGTP